MAAPRSLVTGGAGFLGAHLCEHLLKLGHRVLCLDDLSCGSRARISHLSSYETFRFVVHDICNSLPQEESWRVDYLWHLACPAAPLVYQKNPLKTLEVCFLGTRNCLEHARTGFASRVLFTSTSEVYGNPEVHPQAETYNGNVSTTGPRACYDEGKRVAETLMAEYHRQHPHVDIRIARVFNTYGPKMSEDDGRVVNSFIMQVLRGEPLTVFGNGDQTRTLCYVDDTIRGLIALMMRVDSPSELCKPVNIGGTEELTVSDIADLVRRTAGRPDLPMQAHNLPVDDPVKRRPDLSRARSLLQWHPTVSTADGIRRTWEWFAQSAAHPSSLPSKL